jgi:hypothetical protein
MKQDNFDKLKECYKHIKEPILRDAIDCYLDSADIGMKEIELQFLDSGIKVCEDSEEFLVEVVLALTEELQKTKELLRFYKDEVEYSKRKEL